MRIYIAGSSREIERAERAIKAVRELGHTITVDWPAAMRAEAANGKGDHALTPEEQKRYAEADLDGVAGADLVWLLIPDRENPSVGAWFEAGYALAIARYHEPSTAIVASGVVGGYIFARVLDRLFEDDAAVITWLAGT